MGHPVSEQPPSLTPCSRSDATGFLSLFTCQLASTWHGLLGMVLERKPVGSGIFACVVCAIYGNISDLAPIPPSGLNSRYLFQYIRYSLGVLLLMLFHLKIIQLRSSGCSAIQTPEQDQLEQLRGCFQNCICVLNKYIITSFFSKHWVSLFSRVAQPNSILPRTSRKQQEVFFKPQIYLKQQELMAI